MRRVASCLLLIAAVALAGCDSLTGVEPSASSASAADVAAARAVWDANGPASYRLRYTQSCFCDAGEKEVTVRDGVAVGETGFTIDDLFDLAAAGFGQDGSIEVRLSESAPRFPVLIDIGDPPGIADAAIRVEVTGFEVD
ncbi:MAG TPA: DUF6174 domain-containing protein [Rubricoccaceae bacterium]|jgi:hypothetical protein